MNEPSQLDIFGELTPISEIQEEHKGGVIPMKVVFRGINGYKEGFYCKNCKHLTHHQFRNRYYKCTKLGATGSPASDIRLKDVACKLYIEKEKHSGK